MPESTLASRCSDKHFLTAARPGLAKYRIFNPEIRQVRGRAVPALKARDRAVVGFRAEDSRRIRQSSFGGLPSRDTPQAVAPLAYPAAVDVHAARQSDRSILSGSCINPDRRINSK
jgi:hypothetical protein